jgi:hypothetical protein
MAEDVGSLAGCSTFTKVLMPLQPGSRDHD